MFSNSHFYREMGQMSMARAVVLFFTKKLHFPNNWFNIKRNTRLYVYPRTDDT